MLEIGNSRTRGSTSVGPFVFSVYVRRMRFKLIMAGEVPDDRADVFFRGIPHLVRGLRQHGVVIDFANTGDIEHHKHPDAQLVDGEPLVDIETGRAQLPDETPIAVRSLIAELEDRASSLREDVEHLHKSYEGACKLVADMHSAATGVSGGAPLLGVVEDVEAVRVERDALRDRNHDLRAQLAAARVAANDLSARVVAKTGELALAVDGATELVQPVVENVDESRAAPHDTTSP